MKRFLFALLKATRVISLLAWLNRGKATILCYHSVVEDGQPAPHDPHKQHIRLSLFLEHLDHLQENYRVIPLDHFLRALRNKQRLPDYSIVLTFDDGFHDFFSVAAKELSERQLPATVFIITGRADSTLPPNGESFLSWQEVEQLTRSGIQVGSHTCSHPRLPDLSLAEVRRELADSRTAILDHTKQADLPLSYPYGETSEPVSQLARSLGYSCGITGELGQNSSDADIFALRRTVIASDDDLATFAARVSGLTEWVHRLRQIFRPEEVNEREPEASLACRSPANQT
ncbi:MAG: polysaccharide deacetylase family protein [Pyrinomonadaceae bacterium]